MSIELILMMSTLLVLVAVSVWFIVREKRGKRDRRYVVETLSAMYIRSVESQMLLMSIHVKTLQSELDKAVKNERYEYAKKLSEEIYVNTRTLSLLGKEHDFITGK